LIEQLCREEEGIMRAERVLRQVSRDYEKWAKSITRLKGIMDYTSNMESAREKGREVGGREGEMIGSMETTFKIAHSLKTKGLSLHDIAEATSLPLREIKEL
jgi:predicted transposase/invertase (TIGR01784 family)